MKYREGEEGLMGNEYWDTRTHVWNGEGFDVVELPPLDPEEEDKVPPAIDKEEYQRKVLEAHEAARIEYEAAGIQPPPMDDFLVALMQATEREHT